MSGVRAPMIGIKTGEPAGLEQGFEPQQACVFAVPKAIRQDGTRVMIARMPQPAGVACVADKGPPRVHRGFLASTLDRHGKVGWGRGTQARGVHRLPRGFLLPEFT